MEGHIPPEVQKDRIMRLVELVNSLTRKKSEKYLGKTVEILCEDYDGKKGLYMGRDEFGRMGYFTAGEDMIGKLVRVKITKANGIGAKGANRVIMELKDKLSFDDLFGTDDGYDDASEIGVVQNSNNVEDTVLALVSLGYSEFDAIKTIKQIPDADRMESEELLKAALKKMF